VELTTDILFDARHYGPIAVQSNIDKNKVPPRLLVTVSFDDKTFGLNRVYNHRAIVSLILICPALSRPLRILDLMDQS
jgi:hypothetical protein